MTATDVARICNEANRAYCLTLGDPIPATWDDAPAWQRESALLGVIYHLANPNSKPSDGHESWLREKVATGWKFGPVKDPEKKEHPCMVAYDYLPKAQKAKDALFLGICRALEPYVKIQID
jgi:hypothetical protein